MPNIDAGGFIRDARIYCGISQYDLAERAHTSQAVISRYESGKVSPTVRSLAHLLEAMDLTLTLDWVDNA